VRTLVGIYNALDFCGFIWSLFALHCTIKKDWTVRNYM